MIEGRVLKIDDDDVDAAMRAEDRFRDELGTKGRLAAGSYRLLGNPETKPLRPEIRAAPSGAASLTARATDASRIHRRGNR